MRKQAAKAVLVVLLAATAGAATAPFYPQAARFVLYLDASRDARDTSGKLSFWERLVYSYILASAS